MSGEDPRVTRTRSRLRAAAREELVAEGWGGFTIDGVARRAGAGRATVYRLYGDRLALVVDALGERAERDDGEVPTVEAILDHLVVGWADAGLPAFLDAASREPDLAVPLRTDAVRRRSVLVAAVARHLAEADDGRDPEVVADALAGALLYRRLVVPGRLVPGDAAAVRAAVLG